MKKIRKFLLTLCAITSVSFAFAQNPIYIEITDDCTKKLKYTYSEPNGENYDYYNYHFALNEYETVILKTFSQKTETISFNAEIAQKRITCGESLQNELPFETVEKIQKGQQNVYLLKANDDGYEVIKAIEATYQVYLPNGKYLRVLAREYGFDYDGSATYDPGAALKTAGNGDFILFNEEAFDCYDKPTFMHVPVNFMETANIEYILGIGVVRRYSDIMEHQLISIDGQPFQQYLATFCHGKILDDVEIEPAPEVVKTPVKETTVSAPKKPVLIVPATEPVVVVEEDIDMSLIEEDVAEMLENSTTASKGETVIFKSAPVTKKVDINKNIHVVEVGETLYSISKKYGLSTLQLKTLNQLEENTIEIGQKLKIKK